MGTGLVDGSGVWVDGEDVAAKTGETLGEDTSATAGIENVETLERFGGEGGVAMEFLEIGEEEVNAMVVVLVEDVHGT